VRKKEITMWDAGEHRWSKPTSILVATDLGDIDRLFPLALAQARENGARLILLHVRTAANSMAIDPGGLPYFNSTEAINYTERHLGTFAAEARKAGISCDVLVQQGSAPQRILATASRLQVDRVLLGTRSRGKWGKLLLGSVAEQVLRSVPVPVLTVGPEAHQSTLRAAPMRTVLHATSLSKASRPSAALAFEIAQMTAARLVLMHVLPVGFDLSDLTAGQARSYAVRKLRRLIPPEGPAWCVIDTVVACGDPATEILAQAYASHADLVVLGAQQASPLATLARDGATYRVIAHSHCPVLTLCNHEPVPAAEHATLLRDGTA
jgi:nucleotide-binding universal stress UspA family protein